MLKTIFYFLFILLLSCCHFTKKEVKKYDFVKNSGLKSKTLKIRYSNYDLSDFYYDYTTSRTVFTDKTHNIPQRFLDVFKKIHFNDFTLFIKNESIPGVLNKRGCQDCPNKILNFCVFNDSICFISYVEQPYTEHSVIEFLKLSKTIQFSKIKIYENISDTLIFNDLFKSKLHYCPE